MTGPEDSYGNTRPISVAELLAKNGTIGAPPVGGRRRRRRGNNESVTVAELTGVSPVLSEAPPARGAEPTTDELEELHDDYPAPLSTNGAAEHVDDVDELVDDTELT